MAGIGFELKKVFKKQGLLPLLQGYCYAGVIIIGPMILGIILLFAIRIMGTMGGASKAELDLLVSMITYTLLLSLCITTLFSMITSRYVANKFYEDALEKIMPSFYGSVSIMLMMGLFIYGIFLNFSGIPLTYRLLCLILLIELIVIWAGTNYLTAIKDYLGIVKGFLISTVVSLLFGYIFIKLNIPTISALLVSVTIGYGIMLVDYVLLLQEYFPDGEGSSFEFLKLLDYFPALWLTGIFISIGMFSHILIMWASPIGIRIQGAFYSAPLYDVPALYAFLSVLITSINFVTSIETNFYPRYKKYFQLLNEQGSLKEINQTEEEMLNVLTAELNYTAQKQLFTTLIFIVIVGRILMNLDIGFTSDMHGIYQILCIGYAFYAVGNSFVLATLYFADYKSSLKSSAVFAVTSILGTLLVLYTKSNFYGFGFVLGGMCFYMSAWLKFRNYTTNLKYHILCRQPIKPTIKEGFFTKLSFRLEKLESEIMNHLTKEF